MPLLAMKPTPRLTLHIPLSSKAYLSYVETGYEAPLTKRLQHRPRISNAVAVNPRCIWNVGKYIALFKIARAKHYFLLPFFLLLLAPAFCRAARAASSAASIRRLSSCCAICFSRLASKFLMPSKSPLARMRRRMRPR